MEEFQEVCPYCSCICEPGAVLYCTHYSGARIDGLLCWYATSREKILKQIEDFLSQLEDISVFSKLGEADLIKLINDPKFTDLIKRAEECEYDLENFLIYGYQFKYAEHQNKDNLFIGIYTDRFDIFEDLEAILKKYSNILSAIYTLTKAGYSVSKN